MKAMVLAAGLGSRLGVLGTTLPKALVPVANRLAIDGHLSALRDAGVREVVINVHHLADAIVGHVGNGARFGLRVSYSREARLLGTGGALVPVRALFATEPRFLLVNVDLWHHFDLRAALEHNVRSSAVATLVVRPHPGDRSNWVGSDRAGRLTRVPDMPAAPATALRWAFTGAHVLTPAALEAFPGDGAFCVLRVPYRRLVEQGAALEVYCPPAAPWWDIGTPHRLLTANLRAAGPRALVAPDAVVEPDARLEPPVVVGSRARIGAGSVLTRTVVLPGARVPPRRHFSDVLVFGAGQVVST